MILNITFAALGLGMAFAWLEWPGAAMLVFGLAFVVNLVDTLRANR